MTPRGMPAKSEAEGAAGEAGAAEIEESEEAASEAVRDSGAVAVDAHAVACTAGVRSDGSGDDIEKARVLDRSRNRSARIAAKYDIPPSASKEKRETL